MIDAFHCSWKGKLILTEVVEEFKQGIAQEDEIGNDSWIFASGLILQEAGVFSPVVAVFNSRPMAANELEPLRWGLLAGCHTADEITRGRLLWITLGKALMSDAHQGLGVREVGLGGSCFRQTDLPR